MAGELFGLDIAALVNDSLTSAGGLRPLVLTKSINGTRTPGTLTGGNNPTTTDHTGQGFVDSSTERQGGTLVTTGGMKLSIMGASINPAVEPEPSDTVLLDGTTYTIVEITKVDPAKALYECAVNS